MTRREQWTSFYTAALAGNCADQNQSSADSDKNAAKSADLAMARLAERTFPKPKIATLLEAANAVYDSAVTTSGGHLVRDDFMALLGKAIEDMEAES